MFFHAQRNHLIQSLDRLCYVYITYSYLVNPSLTSLIARLVAQYRITVLKDVQPAHSPRFHLIVLLVISAGPLSRHIFSSSQGSGVLLDFVGRATPAQRAQGLLTDILLLVFQLVQLAIAYETTCWVPEVPDPLFTPPPQSQNPVATTQASSRPRTRPRDRRTRSGPSSSHPRTTRAGYRDVLVRRSRHVRTSTSNFHPDTPIINLPLRTLVRLLTRSFVLGEDVSLPGPATEFRQRIGIVSEVMAMLMRMRAARQQGTEGQASGVAAGR
ncbi:hypothetical protein FRC08_007740 [Ceratobasidium sp. 394]|nr:hypothetical protein FRC08_007740 [Ceratobasidium sp. 394]KAG9076905.1 hypothetical protein FS749_011250 [Ceratobasidium sp. UAMH 11750]